MTNDGMALPSTTTTGQPPPPPFSLPHSPRPRPRLHPAPCFVQAIVSTNIAETSLTIDGVRFVADRQASMQRPLQLPPVAQHARHRCTAAVPAPAPAAVHSSTPACHAAPQAPPPAQPLPPPPPLKALSPFLLPTRSHPPARRPNCAALPCNFCLCIVAPACPPACLRVPAPNAAVVRRK